MGLRLPGRESCYLERHDLQKVTGIMRYVDQSVEYKPCTAIGKNLMHIIPAMQFKPHKASNEPIQKILI